ncbi:MAG: YesL family protein [Faecousia sp.]
MHDLFSPDSKVMKLLGRIADIIILNILYLISCIPILTIGAATSALYTVCFRLGTDAEGPVIKGYFAAFRDNFKQGTIVWLVILAYLLCACYSAVLLYHLQGALRYTFILFAVFALLGLTAFSYAFPLISQFQNRTWRVLYNAFVFSLAYLPKSLLMAALNFFPVVLICFDPNLYIRIGIIWYILYFSAVACVNVRLLRKVFSPFMSQEEEAEGDGEISETNSRES